MHGRILPRRECNSCGFTMKMSSRYQRLSIYDVKRTTKIDGMCPFKLYVVQLQYAIFSFIHRLKPDYLNIKNEIKNLFQVLDLTWTRVTLKANSPSNDGVHIYKHTFTGLQKNTVYVTRIQEYRIQNTRIQECLRLF